jgi:hypothetical protein
MEMQALLNGARQSGTGANAARPWPCAETDGFTDRPGGTDAVRSMSVDTAAQRSTGLQGDTRWGSEKRLLSAPAGAFRDYGGDPSQYQVTDHLVPARRLEGPAEVIAIYDRIGSAGLFGGAWRLLPVVQHRQARMEDNRRSILAIIDLADGRSIAATTGKTGQVTHWITCRLTDTRPGDRVEGRPRPAWLADDPADVPVYGTSLALLLDAALDSGGDISHLETTRLSRLS